MRRGQLLTKSSRVHRSRAAQKCAELLSSPDELVLAPDFDGVLLDYDQPFDPHGGTPIAPEVVSGVKAWESLGAKVIGATARRPEMIEETLRRSNLLIDAVPYHGLYTTTFQDGKFIVEWSLAALELEVSLARTDVLVIEQLRSAFVGSPVLLTNDESVPNRIVFERMAGRRLIRAFTNGQYNDALTSRIIASLAPVAAHLKGQGIKVRPAAWKGGGCELSPEHGRSKGNSYDEIRLMRPKANMIFACDDLNDVIFAEKLRADIDAGRIDGAVLVVWNERAAKGKGTPERLGELADVVLENPLDLGLFFAESAQLARPQQRTSGITTLGRTFDGR